MLEVWEELPWTSILHNQIEIPPNNYSTHSQHPVTSPFPSFVTNWNINQTAQVWPHRAQYNREQLERTDQCVLDGERMNTFYAWSENTHIAPQHTHTHIGKEDPLHLQDFSGHDRAHLHSAVLARLSLLWWILPTWLDNKLIWLLCSRVFASSLCRSAAFWPCSDATLVLFVLISASLVYLFLFFMTEMFRCLFIKNIN